MRRWPWVFHVITRGPGYDHDFVEKWGYGWEELVEAVKEYTPEKVAEICWVDAEDIRRAARLYGNLEARFDAVGASRLTSPPSASPALRPSTIWLA